MSYLIIKTMKNGVSHLTGEDILVNVILVNTIGEIAEFETLEEAENLCGLLMKNSDSGHKYEVKKVG